MSEPVQQAHLPERKQTIYFDKRTLKQVVPRPWLTPVGNFTTLKWPHFDHHIWPSLILRHGRVLKCGPRGWRTKTDLPPQEAAR